MQTLHQKITEAVARGWCADANRSKEMDSDLAIAIVDEVMTALRATVPVPDDQIVDVPEFLRTRKASPNATIGFPAALNLVEQAFDDYKNTHAKWWSRIDGTPIPNDLAVTLAARIAQLHEVSPVAHAVQTLIAALKADPGFAWSYHCNIAMAFVDEGGDRDLADRAAARFMKQWAGVEPAFPL